jgi:hypothetical protein
VIALSLGALIFLSLIGSYVYLIMQGHPYVGSVLFGGGALGIITGFQRARLR